MKDIGFSRYIQIKQNMIILTYAVSRIAKKYKFDFQCRLLLLKQSQEIDTNMIVNKCRNMSINDDYCELDVNSKHAIIF